MKRGVFDYSRVSPKNAFPLWMFSPRECRLKQLNLVHSNRKAGRHQKAWWKTHTFWL